MEGGLLSLKWNNHRSSFIHVLSSLRKKDSFCDVTLACDGKFYPSHKFVLSTCSEYFREMFQQTDCKHPIIVLKDIRCEDIESLLNYMYVGEVNVMQEKLSTLIKAAECLKIKGLAVPDDPAGEKRSLGHDSAPESKRRKTDSDYHKYKDSSKSAKSSKSSDSQYRQSVNDSDANFRSPSSQSDIDRKQSFNFGANQNMCDKFPSNADISDKSKEPDDSVYIKQEPADNIDVEDSKEGILGSSLPPPFLSPLPHEENSNTERIPSSESQDIWGSESRSADGYPPLEGSNSGSQDDADGSQTEAECGRNFGHQSELFPWNCENGAEYQLNKTQDICYRDKSTLSQTSSNSSRPVFSCSFCSYVGFHKSNLVKHMVIHTGIKPFSCPYCSFSSAQKGNVKTHMKKTHSSLPDVKL